MSNQIKKFDKAVLADLVASIEEAKKAKNDCWLSRKEINIIKHINADYIIEKFDYSGRYPKRLGMFLKRNKLGYALRAINKLQGIEKPAKQPKTQEQIIEAWAKRLAKLAGITIEQAKIIAQEKIDYKAEKIALLEDKEAESPSTKRSQLIRKMEKENPLRRITDTEHAQAILSASNRHNNSNYDNLLDKGRELAEMGEIDRDEVQEYARTNMSYK